MATPLLRRSPASDHRSEIKWVEEWAKDVHGREVKLYVLQANDKSVDGRPYLPESPVVPLGRDGRPACLFALRLRRRPDPTEEILAPLIEEGLLTLSLSVDLGLEAPYRPQFARDAAFTIETETGRLAVAHSAGSGARVTFSLTLKPALILGALAAVDGNPSRLIVRTAFDLQGTGAPTGQLAFENSLESIVSGIYADVDRSRVVTILVPSTDGAGYEQLPRLVKVARDRDLAKEPTRVAVMMSARGITPIASAMAPHPAETLNAHALMASEAVHPVGVNTNKVQIAFVDDIALATIQPGTPAEVQHLPFVQDALASLFPDRADGTVYWYPPEFSLVPPAPSDDPAASSFLFSFKRTGTTGGPSPRPTLSGTIRFTLKMGMSAATKAALSAQGNPKTQPVPVNGLTVTFDVPYMDAGQLKVQALRADIEQNSDTITATVPLLDDAVRIAYGSLAYPDDFQSQPARVQVAYSFQAYVPIPIGWPQVVFGGKIALTPVTIARIAPPYLLARPPLSVSSEALLASQKPSSAIRSIAREQAIDVKFPCATFGSFYRDETGAAIGCTDALKLGEFKINLYAEIADLRDLRYRVFRALTQPGVFLVVPTAYRITRFGPKDGDEKAYRPSIMIYAVIDPDVTKNKFFLVATLQPDIPLDARIALETALVAQSPHGVAPSIQYPTELSYSVPPAYRWILPSDMEQPTVQMFVDSFSVALTTGVDNALLLINLIGRTGLSSSVSFTFEDGTELQSSLILDTEIVGPWDTGPVDLQSAADGVTLTNKIERPVNIFDLFTRRGTDSSERVGVNATLAPGNSQRVPIPQPITAAYCTYSVGPGPMTLDELDIFVEDVTTNIIFINQVALNVRGLKGLSAQARLKNTSHVYTLNDVSGASTTLTITLPLTNYLAVQTLQYQITKIAVDGSASTTTWLEADLSKSNIVSITWDLIQN
jgi:hypothetical protein